MREGEKAAPLRCVLRPSRLHPCPHPHCTGSRGRGRRLHTAPAPCLPRAGRRRGGSRAPALPLGTAQRGWRRTAARPLRGQGAVEGHASEAGGVVEVACRRAGWWRTMLAGRAGSVDSPMPVRGAAGGVHGPGALPPYPAGPAPSPPPPPTPTPTPPPTPHPHTHAHRAWCARRRGSAAGPGAAAGRWRKSGCGRRTGPAQIR